MNQEETKANYSLTQFTEDVKKVGKTYKLEIKTSPFGGDKMLIISHEGKVLASPLSIKEVAQNQKLVNFLTFFKANYNVVDKRGRQVLLSI